MLDSNFEAILAGDYFNTQDPMFLRAAEGSLHWYTKALLRGGAFEGVERLGFAGKQTPDHVTRRLLAVKTLAEMEELVAQYGEDAAEQRQEAVRRQQQDGAGHYDPKDEMALHALRSKWMKFFTPFLKIMLERLWTLKAHTARVKEIIDLFGLSEVGVRFSC